MSKFKALSIFTSVLCLYLFYLLFFDPQTLFSDLGIEGSQTAYFMSRRASMLMLGISVLTFFARGIPQSQAMQAISLSVCVTMFGLAMTGMYEFIRGFVSNDIFISIIIESILSLSFFCLWFSNRQKISKA